MSPPTDGLETAMLGQVLQATRRKITNMAGGTERLEFLLKKAGAKPVSHPFSPELRAERLVSPEEPNPIDPTGKVRNGNNAQAVGS